MTTPVSGSISLTHVLAELQTMNPGRGFPISLGDSDVRQLAGVLSGPISMSDLYNKSAYVPMSGQAFDDVQSFSSYRAGTASTHPYATLSNGIAPYSITWSFTSNPDNAVINAGQGTLTPTVSTTYGRFAEGGFTADLQCVIIDGAGNTLTLNCSVIADWA